MSEETYMSYSTDVCCASCFKVLELIPPEKLELAQLHTIDGDCVVKRGGKTIKVFSKYEDYAFTDAEKYKNQLNQEILEGSL